VKLIQVGHIGEAFADVIQLSGLQLR
jgi:hypothetical protein